MRARWMAAAALAALFVGGTAVGARAGWMIQEADPEFPDEVTTYWYQGGKVKIEGALEGLTLIIDVKKQEGWIVDAVNKKAAGGKIAELAEQLKKLESEEAALGEEMAVEGAGEEEAPGDVPAGEQAVGEPPPPDLPAEAEEELPPEEPPTPQTVEVKDLGAGEKILGFETKRYQVLADNEMVEELWVAPKVEVEKEVDLAEFQASLQKMLGGGDGMNQGYEETPAYKKLRATGYVLRQILYFVGEKSVLEVKKAEKSAFPDSAFAVPPGMAKIGYVDLLVGESPE